jgi:hypothetical protein
MKTTTTNESTQDASTASCCKLFRRGRDGAPQKQQQSRLQHEHKIPDVENQLNGNNYIHHNLSTSSAECSTLYNEYRASFPERLDFVESLPDLNDMRLLRPLIGNMKFADFRIESFKMWPIYSKIAIQELVSAGFFCVNAKRKIIKCFYCGCAFYNLKENDSILALHAAYFPRCGYVLTVMGSAYARRLNAKVIKNEK